MRKATEEKVNTIDLHQIDELFDKLETKQFEKIRLNKTLSFYKTLLNPPDTIIYINDLINERKIWSNNNYEYITGYSIEEARRMGRKYFQYAYHKDENQLFWLNRKQTNKKQWYGIYRFRHKNGQMMWFYSFARVLKYDIQDNPWLVVEIAINITESIKQEEELKNLIQENYALKYKGIEEFLSRQEKKILKYIARGYSSKKIACAENLSCYTVETHRKNILRKLEIKNTAELIRLASYCELI